MKEKDLSLSRNDSKENPDEIASKKGGPSSRFHVLSDEDPMLLQLNTEERKSIVNLRQSFGIEFENYLEVAGSQNIFTPKMA